MSRIEKIFSQLQQHNKKALIPWLAVGFPSKQLTVPLLHAYVDAGADLLEIGVPFSDPVADGPVIQVAYECALKQGVSLTEVFDAIKTFRKQNQVTPIVLMSYLNPIEIFGYHAFAEQANEAGVDAVLVVDLPLEEGTEFFQALKAHAIDPIFLIAPTTSDARIQRLANHASGFLYCVSFKGVTGAGQLDFDEIKKRVQNLRDYTSLPIAVGFGITNPASAKTVASFADGVIVASALIKEINTHQDEATLLPRVTDWLSQLRYAIDSV